MIEKIGSVHLDISDWDGQDKYTDGEIEQELLKRLQAGETPEEILRSDTRYPVIYHFSPERHNLSLIHIFFMHLFYSNGCGRKPEMRQKRF